MFSDGKKLIIAHRGASAYARGNTIASYLKAIDMGADMIEFDVRKTADDVLIAYHDECIGNGPIGRLTFNEIGKAARIMGFKIPVLEEILKLACGQIGLDIELKESGYEEEVIGLAGRYLTEEEYIITSSHEASLRNVKMVNPKVLAGLILSGDNDSDARMIPEADILIPNSGLLSKKTFLEKAQKENKPFIAWTLNDEEEIRTFLQKDEIKGIITDKPDVAVLIRKDLQA
jgi:glycerophosphoryl diester phosphodiesterase